MLYRLTRVKSLSSVQSLHHKSCPRLVSYRPLAGETPQPQTSIPSAPLEACTRSVNQPAPQRRSAGGGVREEGEDIEVVELPLERAWQALDQNEIVDAKTLVALLWCRRKFAAKQPHGRTLPEP